MAESATVSPRPERHSRAGALWSDVVRKDTADVELHQGVVTGDLRVLVVRSGADVSHMSALDLVRQMLRGAG